MGWQNVPTPEELARENIDKQLKSCGWIVQSSSEMNLYAGRGVAVREFPVEGGFADYMLFVDRSAVGVIEAGILKEVTGYARNRIFRADEIYKALEAISN
jgi:type I site-specific restriction endonuclease